MSLVLSVNPKILRSYLRFRGTPKWSHCHSFTVYNAFHLRRVLLLPNSKLSTTSEKFMKPHYSCRHLALYPIHMAYLKSNVVISDAVVHASRTFATSSQGKSKLEDAENSSKDLDEIALEAERLRQSMSSSKASEPASDGSAMVPASSNKDKKPLLQRVKAEILHYYHGFRLLWLDFKVALRLGFNVLFRGKSLTRRERRQLVRTVADLFRLVPFLVFIIVPFAEFLLPVYLKFFPFMLPSTFQEKQKEQEKKRQLFKGKLEIAKFLQDTLNERYGHAQVEDAPTMQQFAEFMQRVRHTGQVASTKDILRFSRLFEDEVTLDSLDHRTLKGLCQLLDLNSRGPPQLLRFQIRMRMKQLYVDDKVVRMDGVEQLPIWDLQTLCRERGMRAVGLSEERLRFQLAQWLELHLDKKVPMMLLLLTRTMYLPETFTAEEQIKEAILRLPETVSKAASLNASPDEEGMGIKARYEVLKMEEETLRKEAAAEEKLESEQLKDSGKLLKDSAASLTEADAALKPTEGERGESFYGVLPTDPTWKLVSSHEMEPEVTARDLQQIESAIESIQDTSTLLDEEELDELKEKLTELQQQHQLPVPADPAILASKSKAQLRGATHLERHMKRLIADMDSIIGNLHEERTQVQRLLEAKEKSQECTEEERQRMVSINDLMLSLRRIQKVPDDAKWQRILQVLDEDKDGNIEIEHIYRVVELLGKENVKLSSKEMKRVLSTIDKESFMEDLQKRIQQEKTESHSSASHQQEIR